MLIWTSIQHQMDTGAYMSSYKSCFCGPTSMRRKLLIQRPGGPHKEYLGVRTQRVLCCGFSIVLSSRYTREGRLPSNTPGLERPSPPWHPDTAIKSQVAPQPGGSQLWHLEGFKRTTRGKVGYCKTSPPAVTCLPPHLYLYLAANVLKPTIIFYSERLWSGQCKS